MSGERTDEITECVKRRIVHMSRWPWQRIMAVDMSIEDMRERKLDDRVKERNAGPAVSKAAQTVINR
jgi:hypothetical protein